MGRRTLIDWTDTGSNSEWSKVIVDLEARVRGLAEGGVELAEGSGIGVLTAGQWYFDIANSKLYARATDSGDPNSKTMELLTYYLRFGTWATQTEMDNLELFQIFTPTRDMYIRHIRFWIGRRGGPTISNLRLEIHPELSSAPTPFVLAESSKTWTNAEISSSDYSASEIYCTFNDYAVKKDDLYCLVMRAEGTFTESSNFAWLKLDSVYDDTIGSTANAISRGGLDFKIIEREI